MSTPSSEKSQVFFDNLISFLIATVSVILAIVAVLQIDASHTSQRANREAQRLSIQATEEKVSGILQFNHDWYGIYEKWMENDLRAVSARQEGDDVTQARYNALRDQLSALSPLLREPYFDAQTQSTRASQYEAELYLVDATKLSEQFAAVSDVGRHWGSIADMHVVQLTLLAVALSLFGLANTMKSGLRWMFVGLGGLMVLFSMAWAALLLIRPHPGVNHTAIEAYAKGVGKNYQESYDEAIQLFDQALAANPDYGNSYYERGNAYFGKSNYAAAAADYEEALKAGRDDANVNWNLAWTYYLLGDFERARQINETILEKDPTLIGILMNQGLVMLSEGKFDDARLIYTEALNEAASQVMEAHNNNQQPPSSLWFYIDASAIDLQNLLDRVSGMPKDWTKAPESDVIHADAEQIKAFASEQIKTIKEATVALQYTGQLPERAATIQVEPFKFGKEAYDDQGNYTGFDSATSFEFGTDAVTVTFDYTGYVPGQKVLWKVYINGEESPAYRESWIEDLEESGSYFKYIGFGYTNVYVLPSGEYTVEVYVDSRLVQRGTFTILDQE